MKVVLCYGDSNTWGSDPASDERFAWDQRWTGVLRQSLGDGYHVIEEGLNGRTTVWDDPIEGYKSGKEYLIPCLESHRPIDLVVLMLGTNDLKMRFSLPTSDIAAGIETLVKIVQQNGIGPDGTAPKILLMAPPPLGKLTEYADMFEGGTAKSQTFGTHYRRVADEYGCDFLDSSDIIVSSDTDGIHFDPSEHKNLGQALAPLVRQILKT
jgi:lysophospholipase L1-like esterase